MAGSDGGLALVDRIGGDAIARRDGPGGGTAVFIAGAFIAGLLLWWLLPVTPITTGLQFDVSTLGWAIGAALLWWITSMLALVWATARLEPTRVGILLMSEVLVGVLSAALLAGETMTAVQILGAALLLVAGFMEAIAG